MHGVFAGRTQIDMKGQMGNWDAEFKVQTHYMVIIKSCYVEAWHPLAVESYNKKVDIKLYF